MKTSLILVALICSMVGCAVFAYLWIDRSISLSYARQSSEASNNAIRQMEFLLESEWLGLPEKQLMQKLQRVSTKAAPNAVVKKEDGVIWFDEIPFNIENGQLKSIGNNKAGK